VWERATAVLQNLPEAARQRLQVFLMGPVSDADIDLARRLAELRPDPAPVRYGIVAPLPSRPIAQHALEVAAERGHRQQERHRQAFAARIKEFNERLHTTYPVDDDIRLGQLMDDTHEYLRTRPIIHNLDFVGEAKVGSETMTWAEHATSSHEFKTFWETGLSTGTPFAPRRGYLEERMATGMLNRTGGNPEVDLWAINIRPDPVGANALLWLSSLARSAWRRVRLRLDRVPHEGGRAGPHNLHPAGQRHHW
jgi:hypothetical protein